LAVPGFQSVPGWKFREVGVLSLQVGVPTKEE
jgi:hypothetical protein